MRDYLKSRHPELWRWFQSTEAQANYGEAVQLELLKTTYRMEEEGHPEHYQRVREALERLELDIPVTLYQAQNAGLDSAALYFTPGHGHVVFVGRVLEFLTPDELRALVGHELAHFKLWTVEGGEFLIADQVMSAMANEPRATPSHHESARLMQLYNEVYADRGAALVSGEDRAATSMLLKIVTGLETVDPESYLRQAEDVFSRKAQAAEGWTHPEPYIRARALALWSNEQAEPDAEAEVARMIEGGQRFDELDLLGQRELEGATQRLIAYHLRWRWLKTERIMAHAGMFFPAGLPDGRSELDAIRADWTGGDDKLHDYACFLLLDFAVVDPELEENALAASFTTAEELELGDRLEALVRKELKLLKRDTTRVREKAAEMVQAATREEADDE